MRELKKPPAWKNEPLNHRIELICPAKVEEEKVDGYERNGQAWFVATELQSDLWVEVDSTSFHLHKFPLLSRSGRLNRLVFESRDTEKHRIKLADLPGGAGAFELAAKFCYGVAVELTPVNVASLRCAAEYLEMTDDLEEGNLVSKTEAFLSFVVLASWKDSITVLRSCEPLSPWSDKLQIVQRCSESIAWKACTDPKGIRWSFTATGGTGRKHSSTPADTSLAEDLEKSIPQDWWFEDVCVLNTEYFVRIINAIKAKGMPADLLGAAVSHYALKRLPGLLKDCSIQDESVEGAGPIVSSGKGAPSAEDFAALRHTNRMLLETVLSVLPAQKDAVSCNFLLRLLREACMLNVDVSHRVELERRVGMQLEQASVADLLIPSFSLTAKTLFDVDLVFRLVQYFLAQDLSSEAIVKPLMPVMETPAKQVSASHAARSKVIKVLDGYLAEIASDSELSLYSFLAIAESIPDAARVCDDVLYKAIDTYLKAHPDLTEDERKSLCHNIDGRKLSLDACAHASQNDRLPLRTVVQVLYCEQMKLRNAIAGGSLTEYRYHIPQDSQFARISSSDSDPQSSRDGWPPFCTDVRALQHDVQQMRAEFLGLKTFCAGLQEQVDKMSKSRGLFSWSFGWKKLSKFTASILLPQGRSTADRPVSFEAPPTLARDSSEGSRKPRIWRRNSLS